MIKLTRDAIDELKCPPGKRDAIFFDTELRGLSVRVTKEGTKTFQYQYTSPATGLSRRIRLGRVGVITLAEARTAAKVAAGKVAQGIDLASEKRTEREAEKQKRAAAAAASATADFTLNKLIDEWQTLGLVRRRPRYRAEACRALRLAFTKDLHKPASALLRARVLQVIDGYDQEAKHATARLVRAYGRACFTWAVKRGRLAENPFDGLPLGVAAVARDRLLTDAEIGAIWRAACDMPEPAGPFVRLALLTLARRDEVAAMRWSEISQDLTAWTIPAQRMKRGQAHVVTLTDAAREALGAVTRIEGQDLVFTTTGKTPISGFSKIKARLDKRSGVSGWVLHDFRRAGASCLARLGFSSIVADKLLAHQPSALTSVARVYQQHDFMAEKSVALRAWVAHVLECAKQNIEVS
jgi:integrase